MRKTLWTVCFFMGVFALQLQGQNPSDELFCYHMKIKGVIGTGALNYLSRGITKAEEDSGCLLVELDTPGGHLQATREMVQLLLKDKVTSIVWVGPSGAHAGSAGVFITSAAQHAYMASGTNIGAAHPVAGTGQDVKGDIGKKVLNDTKAFALSIAEKRNRNKTWLVSSVEESISVTSSEALALGAIDGISDSPQDVLNKVYPDKKVKLKLLEPTVSERLASFVSHPNVSYMLMGFGALGLYIEISNPGLLFPGIAGLLCLILSFISMNFIPVNYGGVALVFVGLVLLVAEIFVPSFGILGISGITSFLLGSLFFVNESQSEIQVGLEMILPITCAIAVVAIFVARALLNLRHKKVSHGEEAMLGQDCVVDLWDDGSKTGKGIVQGDLYNIISEKTLAKDQVVKVVHVDGLTLSVE